MTEILRARALIADARVARQEALDARDRVRVALVMAASNLALAHLRLKAVGKT